jgi:hypothetical protein
MKEVSCNCRGSVGVLIQVQQDAAMFEVSVQAQSIRRAVGIAAARHPGVDVRVELPIDPETFFVEESSAHTSSIASQTAPVCL